MSQKLALSFSQYSRTWLAAVLLGLALLLSIPAALADYGMPTSAPSFRLPRQTATPSYRPTVSAPSSSAAQPFAMLPPPDPSYVQRTAPYNLNAAPGRPSSNPYAASRSPRNPYAVSNTSSNPYAAPNAVRNPYALPSASSNPYNLGAETDANFRKPDKYADNPQVDGDGVRHFANGRHFDLSKTSLGDAIAQTNSSTLGGNNRNPNQQRKLAKFGNNFNPGGGNIDPPSLGFGGANSNFGGRNNFDNGFGNNFPGRGGFNNNNNFGGQNNFDNGRNLAGNNFGGGNNSGAWRNGARGNPGRRGNGYGQSPQRPYVYDWSQSPTADLNNQSYSMQTQDWAGGSQPRLAMRNRRRLRNRDMQIRDYQW